MPCNGRSERPRSSRLLQLSDKKDLLAPYVPEDFDEFWTEAVDEAKSAPLDFHRSGTGDYLMSGFRIETLTFRGVDGKVKSGWIAYPPDAHRNPGFLWIPP